MSEAIHYERVKEHLESLKLLAALNELDSLLEAGSREERSVSWFLDELLTREVTHRFAPSFSVSWLPVSGA